LGEMKWNIINLCDVGHVAGLSEVRNMYTVLVENLEGKRSLG